MFFSEDKIVDCTLSFPLTRNLSPSFFARIVNPDLFSTHNSQSLSSSSTPKQSTQQEEKDSIPLPSQSSHIPNIGRLIEDMEIKLRNQLQEVYFGKTKDVLNGVRSFSGLGQKSKEEALRRELVSRFLDRSGFCREAEGESNGVRYDSDQLIFLHALLAFPPLPVLALVQMANMKR